MFTALHGRRKTQLLLGLFTGILFGFLLQKGGVTRYDVIIDQLLLVDFTVLKVMLSAVVVGMIGLQVLRSLKLVSLHPKTDSISAAVIGGIIFGAGFATMGYCPGTLMGSLGNGHMDALAGGIGVVVGAGIFAAMYGRLQRRTLKIAQPKELTIPQRLGVNSWVVVIPVEILLVLLLWWMERAGL